VNSLPLVNIANSIEHNFDYSNFWTGHTAAAWLNTSFLYNHVNTYVVSTTFDELHFIGWKAGHWYRLYPMWWIQASPIHNTQSHTVQSLTNVSSRTLLTHLFWSTAHRMSCKAHIVKVQCSNNVCSSLTRPSSPVGCQRWATRTKFFHCFLSLTHCHTLLPLCCKSSDVVNHQFLFCRPPPRLLVLDINVSSALAGNLELFIHFAWPNHCSLHLCIFWFNSSPMSSFFFLSSADAC